MLEVCIVQYGCLLTVSVTGFGKHLNLYMLQLAVYVYTAIPCVSVLFSLQLSRIVQPYMGFCSTCASMVVVTDDCHGHVQL